MPRQARTEQDGSPSRSLRLVLIALLFVAAVGTIVVLVQRGDATSGGSASPATQPSATASTPAASAAPTRSTTSSSTARPSPQNQSPTTRKGDRLVALSALPPQAQATWRLVQQGGPFPYDRDGVVFENRERLLPSHTRGYYHEYTVPTPGESDRGARRLITGASGELFYTDDHYDSFVVVDPSR